MKPAQYDAFKIEGSRLLVTLPVPETVEEYDGLAGKTGACLESGIDNVVYRGGSCLPEVRYQFCDLFEKSITREFRIGNDLQQAADGGDTDAQQQIELRKALFRKTKSLGKKKVKGSNGAPDSEEEKIVFAEGEAEYVRRVLPILALLRGADEVKVETFQSLMDNVLSLTEEIDDPANPGSKISVNLVRFDPTERERAERGPKTLPKKYLAAGQQIVNDGQADGFIAHYSVQVADLPEDATEAQINEAKAQAIGWKIKALEDAEAAKTNLAAKYGVPTA